MKREYDVSAAVRSTLKEKAENHNADVGNVASKRTTTRTLVAVFERGVGAYNSNPGSVRPRVNSFLYCLRNGRFRGGKHDTDLLPKGHPQSSKSKGPDDEYDPPCRKPGELYDECVSRKIGSIMAEDPTMESAQAVAIARSMCEKRCDE